MVGKTRKNTRRNSKSRRNTRRNTNRNSKSRRNTRRNTRRKSRRDNRRVYRGGSDKEELEKCKEEVKELKNRLMEYDVGPNSSDERYFSKFNKEMMGKPQMPNTSDENYFDGIRNLFLEKESDAFDVRLSSDNTKKMKEKKLGLAVNRNKGTNFLRPKMSMLDNAQMKNKEVSKSALDRLKYYQDKVAAYTSAEKKKFNKERMKEKRFRSSRGVSGRSKSRYSSRA